MVIKSWTVTDLVSTKQHLDLRHSESNHDKGIFQYFRRCSREEHLENIRQVDENYQDECEQHRQKEKLLQLEKVVQLQEQNRQRKRAQQARENEKVCNSTAHQQLKVQQ
jgi:hypothetical protein